MGKPSQRKPAKKPAAAKVRQFIHVEFVDGLIVVHAQLSTDGTLGPMIAETLRAHLTPDVDTN